MAMGTNRNVAPQETSCTGRPRSLEYQKLDSERPRDRRQVPDGLPEDRRELIHPGEAKLLPLPLEINRDGADAFPENDARFPGAIFPRARERKRSR